MLIQSAVMTAGSGSLGGLTASHNAGGLYLRARVVPTNPNTAAQNVVRTAVADLVNLWQGTLTQVQRDAWDSYAAAVPLMGPLGSPRTVSGLNMYVRANVPRIQSGEPRVDDGPTILNLGSFTAVSVPIASAASDDLGFIFTNTDDWANEDDAAMLVYQGRPQNPTINFFRGPYRLAGVVQGDGTTPPTSPAALTAPFTFSAGQKVFTRVVVSRADGRYSNTQYVSVIAIA